MKIGLTGGIGSGKSTVSAILSQKGISIIDADKIAKALLQPGTKTYEEVEDYFGTTDRKSLGAMVFSQEGKRQKLNAIMHPAIRQEILDQIQTYQQQGEKIIVVDAPLLIESRMYDMVDKIWLVCVDVETQIERVMKRDQGTREEALQRIEAQMPLEEKKKYADVIIENNRTVEALEKIITMLLE